jgi:hypothetical protein
MNFYRSSVIPVLKVLILSCALATGTAHAADPPDALTAHLGSAAHHTPGLSSTVRTPLDLKVPEVRRVMSHSQLLAAIGRGSEDEELVEVVAAPALMPMSSDAQAPLGIIGSLQWSVDHPTQAWRILLPSAVTP